MLHSVWLQLCVTATLLELKSLGVCISAHLHCASAAMSSNTEIKLLCRNHFCTGQAFSNAATFPRQELGQIFLEVIHLACAWRKSHTARDG